MKKNLIVLSLITLLGTTLPTFAHPMGGPHGGPHGCPRPQPMRCAPHHPPMHNIPRFGMSFGYYPRHIYPAPYYYNYPINYPCYNYYGINSGYYVPDVYLNFRL